MFNITDLIAKPVISLCEGIVLGTVANAVFDQKLKKVKYLAVFNEDKEDKLYIPSSYIFNALNNAVIIKNSPLPANTKVLENSPLKAPVYLYDGAESGYISDMEIDDKLEVVNLKKDDGSILEIKNIISFSSDAVIVCFDKDKLANLKKIKPKKAAADKKDNADCIKKTEAMPIEIKAAPEIININEIETIPEEINNFSADIIDGKKETPVDISEKEKETSDNISAKIKEADTAEINNTEIINESDNEDIYYIRNIVPLFNYLIGRKSTENIKNQINEIIVPKNSVITIDHIDKCRKYGKLLLLAKYSVGHH